MEIQGASTATGSLQVFYKSQRSQCEIAPQIGTSLGSSSPVLPEMVQPGSAVGGCGCASISKGQASRGRALPHFRFPARTAPAMVRDQGLGASLCFAWRGCGSGGDAACR